jgi:hypothetical protein
VYGCHSSNPVNLYVVSLVVTGDNAVPFKYGVTRYVNGPSPDVGAAQDTTIDPTVNVIPVTAPGIAGTYGGVLIDALSSGQGHPGLMATHALYRVYSVICPVLTAFITELS